MSNGQRIDPAIQAALIEARERVNQSSVHPAQQVYVALLHRTRLGQLKWERGRYSGFAACLDDSLLVEIQLEDGVHTIYVRRRCGNAPADRTILNVTGSFHALWEAAAACRQDCFEHEDGALDAVLTAARRYPEGQEL